MPKYDFSDFDEKPQYDFSDFDVPVSQFESGVRSVAQGASAGFADELTAALESGAGSLGLVPDKTYEQSLEESRANYKAAQEANPLTSLAGNLAGGIGSALLMPASAATIPGRIAQAAGMGAVTGYGMNENRDEALKDIAMGGAIGGAVGGLAEGATLGLKKLGESMGRGAESLMTKATGATGKEAAKFKPGTGRALLENPDIKFWHTPADIARVTGEQLEASGNKMSQALSSLDDTGTTIPAEDLASLLSQRADALRQGPTKPLANQIDSLVENIRGTAPTSTNKLQLNESGQLVLKPSQVEGWKRDYGDLIKNWTDQTAGVANKEAYDVMKGTTEKIAQEAGGDIANVFNAAKEQYGTLMPVHEAAARRAGVTNQSPFGGLMDMQRLQAGAMMSPGNELPGGFVATMASKIIAPRAANTTARSLNKVSNLIKTPPAMLGKFAPVIQNAAARGQNAVAVTDWLLEQNNPEYREMKSRLENGN